MILHSIHALDVMAGEREMSLRRMTWTTGRNRSRRHLRRWLGRQLVRAGVRLAAEPILRPAPVR